MLRNDPNTLLNVVVVSVIGTVIVCCAMGGVILAHAGKAVPEFIAPVVTAGVAGLTGYLSGGYQRKDAAVEPKVVKPVAARRNVP